MQRLTDMAEKSSSLLSSWMRSSAAESNGWQQIGSPAPADEAVSAHEESELHKLLSKPLKVQKAAAIVSHIKANPVEATSRHPVSRGLPLHRAQQPDVLAALLEAHPEGATARDGTGAVALHHVATAWAFEKLHAACPDAVTMVNHDGMLPLHVALDNARPKELVRALVNAYPEGVQRPSRKGNKLPIRIAMDRKLPREIIDALVEAHTESAVVAIGGATGQGAYLYEMATWCVEAIDRSLVPSFVEDGPGTLLRAVHAYKNVTSAASRAQSSNTEIADLLRDGATRLQLIACGLVGQMSKAELEGMLNSSKGFLALRAATEADCRLLLGRPRVQQFLQVCTPPAPPAPPPQQISRRAPRAPPARLPPAARKDSGSAPCASRLRPKNCRIATRRSPPLCASHSHPASTTPPASTNPPARLHHQPTRLSSAQVRFHGEELSSIFNSTEPWLDTNHGAYALLTRSRAARFVLWSLNAVLLHPLFLLVAGLWPPLLPWLEARVPTPAAETKLKDDKDGKDGEGAAGDAGSAAGTGGVVCGTRMHGYLLHRAPIVVSFADIAGNLALAYQLITSALVPPTDAFGDGSSGDVGGGASRLAEWLAPGPLQQSGSSEVCVPLWWLCVLTARWSLPLLLLWIALTIQREVRARSQIVGSEPNRAPNRAPIGAPIGAPNRSL